MEHKISFASDNYAGVDQEIMQYLLEINKGHVSGYGEDVYTEKALELFKQEFGNDIEVFFVYNGTAANTLALGQLTQSYNSVICTDLSHIVIHEVTAPQTWTGCKFLPLPSKNGKISSLQIQRIFEDETFWGRHTALPKVVSLSQTTEVGTIYSIEEIKEIASYCHINNMYLHIDGARIANACEALGVSFKEMIVDSGVDALSFGGTKNGLMFGEAIVFFNKSLAENFEYVQKQGLQLHSKMRFISAQYIPYLENNIWKRNAANSNQLALKLAKQLDEILPNCLAFKAQSNQIFVRLDAKIISKLEKDFHFYIFDPRQNIVRLVTSFDSKLQDVEVFVNRLKQILI